MNLNFDPYLILNIPYDADDEDIKIAFHSAVQKNPDNSELHNAYNTIRNKEQRRLFKWESVYSYISPPPTQVKQGISMNDLANELAFLSNWELGIEEL